MDVFGNHEVTNLAVKKYIVWLPSHFSKLTLRNPTFVLVLSQPRQQADTIASNELQLLSCSNPLLAVPTIPIIEASNELQLLSCSNYT